ncbi:MAG TPA: bacillithiol biosynthesis cysteine-adding enzyme BshC, partial [Candidatus Limnocylindrales bacterium]|nr:bacillithiol biosynthesis cysteine-adding enzyme BshC [Candidatus Limnocylindrales bacterium]
PPDVAHVAAFAKSVPRDRERQARVADALEKQNRAWGASEPTLRNIQRLRDGAFAVVTGQQVGLFGGPLMSLFKAASVLALAGQVEQSGVECVPVFWLATEDHDLDEVNQALLLTHDFQLMPFTAKTAGVTGAPVAHIRFAEGTNELAAEAAKLLGESLAADYLRESYAEGETFSNTFAKLYTRIFSGREHGLIFLDPADPDLHRIAAPLFVDALHRSAELDHAVLERNQELRDHGYHEQVKVTPESTPLFALVDGARVPVQRANGTFTIAKKSVSAEELQKRIETAPENFSANVLLRPVLQDYWLPTLAYIGGPAEIAYFAQAAVVYEKLLGRVTPILPRMSATLIEPRIERLLNKYEVELPELFHGECQLRDCLATRSLPAELKQDFEQTRLAVESSMQRVSQSLQTLDPTLVEAGGRAVSKMHYQVNRLEKRAAQAELRRTEVLSRHAAQMENALYPNKSLQEREIAGIYFYANHGPELINRLIELAQARCPEHKVLRLGGPQTDETTSDVSRRLPRIFIRDENQARRSLR